ncbi:MAG: hypothetical protein LKG27_04770 [Clostridiaceae bacterium]|jgi:hypothetical protein|nr:hypothetical protein [Clostridiaceae bacterium]
MGDSSCTIAPVCSHKLTATYDPKGCTAPSVSEFLKSGDSKTLTAALKTNDAQNTYKFNGWSGDSSSSNQSISVTMADKSLSYLANCSNNPLPFITVSHDGSCESASGGGQLSATSGSKDISATPVAHGSFIRWTTNCDSIADPSSPSTSASTDHDCKAVATCGSAPTHTLYVSYIDSAAGTVTPSSVPGLTQDSQYSPISTKLASSDYRLSTTQTQWVADTCTLNSSSGDSNSVKAMGDSDCHVKIATNKKHLLTVKVDNADVLAALTDGSGANLVAASAPPVSTKLFVNDKANISLSLSSAAISADKALNNMSDWNFSADTCSVDSSGHVTMGDSDCTVSITGVKSPKNLHKLTVTPMPSAGGNPYIGTIGTTVAYFNQGDSASITTNPNSGYKVDSASASGCASGPTLASDNSSASITMAATDCNVTIMYANIPTASTYNITLTDTFQGTSAVRSMTSDAPSGTSFFDTVYTSTYKHYDGGDEETDSQTTNISNGTTWIKYDNGWGNGIGQGNDADGNYEICKETSYQSYTLKTPSGKVYTGNYSGGVVNGFQIVTSEGTFNISHEVEVKTIPVSADNCTVTSGDYYTVLPDGYNTDKYHTIAVSCIAGVSGSVNISGTVRRTTYDANGKATITQTPFSTVANPTASWTDVERYPNKDDYGRANGYTTDTLNLKYILYINGQKIKEW